MAGEGDTQINPVEVKASQVNAELDAVWNSEITAENIRSFSDDCLKKVVEIVTRVTKEKFPGENITPELEDTALGELGLDVTATLNQLQKAIEQKDSEIRNIFDFVTNSEVIDTVLIPPSDRRFPPKGLDVAGEKQPDTHRVEMVIYMLHHDCGISFDEIKIVKGVVLKDMVRQTPYVRVEAMGKVIYVSNEPLNSTFVIDVTTLPGGITIYELDRMTKDELEVLVKRNPKENFLIRFTKFWGENLFQAINGTRKTKRKKDLEEINPNKYPSPIDDENDLMNGFILVDGEFWGNASRIVQFLGVTQSRFTTLKEKGLKAGMKTKKMFNGRNILEAYPVDVIKLLDKARDLPMGIKEKGPFYGYLLLDGKHFGTSWNIGKNLGVNISTFADFLSRHKIRSEYYFFNGIKKGYCYEDTMSVVYDIRKYPLATLDNKYRVKLWVDSEGKHWGTSLEIAKLLNISSRTVRLRARLRMIIRLYEITEANAYCLEDLIKSIEEKPLHAGP